MSMNARDFISEAIDADSLDRAFHGRLDAMRLTGEKLVKEHQHQCAMTLLQGGLTLIPSDHLLDHQFVVSRAVYEAAKRITGTG